jgi:hypothetical protein
VEALTNQISGTGDIPEAARLRWDASGMQKPQFGLNQKAILMVLFYGRLARELAGLAF